jgi:hypothetical protein
LTPSVLDCAARFLMPSRLPVSYIFKVKGKEEAERLSYDNNFGLINKSSLSDKIL